MEAHSNKARGIVVTMLWLVLAGIVLTLITISPANKKLSVFLIVASFSSLMFILLWFGNAVACDLMDRWIDWIKEPLKRLVVGILVMVAYTGLASYGLVLLYKTAFGLRVGDTTTFQYSTIVVTLIITMFMHGRSFLKSWKSAEIEAEKAKKESVRANYESFKNQVNPHFLFNSLNVLTDLVYEDQDKAAKFIKQLSEVYRHVLDSRNMEVATLEEELRYLNAYLFLQQIRFGDKLKIENELKPSRGNIPPLAASNAGGKCHQAQCGFGGAAPRHPPICRKWQFGCGQQPSEKSAAHRQAGGRGFGKHQKPVPFFDRSPRFGRKRQRAVYRKTPNPA